jgi:crotonobetainyl-CoA:carnitine CoA-transferase CaiB-like acyl-CoA transferase
MQPPRAGEHTDAILTALGYSTEKVAELRQAGAIS